MGDVYVYLCGQCRVLKICKEEGSWRVVKDVD